MNTVYTLTLIEIKAYLRNWTAVFWTFAYPITLLFLLSIMFGGNNDHTIILVLENGKENPRVNEYVAALHEKADRIDGLHLNTVWLEDNSNHEPQPGALQLIFSPNFGSSITPSLVSLSVNGDINIRVNAAISLIAETTEIFNRVITNGRQQIAMDYSKMTFNKKEFNNYNAFLISGLIALTIVSTAMFGFATVLVDMRQNGALKMFQVMPMTRGQFFSGFVLSRTLILAVFCIVFYLLANKSLNTNVPLYLENMSAFIILLILGIISFLSVGLLFVSILKKGSTAIAIINIVNLPVIFLSDLFIPVAVMPEFIRSIAEISPVYLFVNAMRDVTLTDFSYIDIVPSIISLSSVSILCFIISSKLFKWRSA